MLILPHRSGFFHPDLINTADAVVGKLGYSTLAEVFHAGVPFGYVARADFRESAQLVAFMRTRMASMALDESEFENGRWTDRLDELLALPHTQPAGTNGAEQIGRFILDLII